MQTQISVFVRKGMARNTSAGMSLSPGGSTNAVSDSSVCVEFGNCRTFGCFGSARALDRSNTAATGYGRSLSGVFRHTAVRCIQFMHNGPQHPRFSNFPLFCRI